MAIFEEKYGEMGPDGGGRRVQQGALRRGPRAGDRRDRAVQDVVGIEHRGRHAPDRGRHRGGGAPPCPGDEGHTGRTSRDWAVPKRDPAHVEKIMAQLADAEKEIRGLQAEGRPGSRPGPERSASATVKGVAVMARRIEGLAGAELRNVADSLKQKMGSGVVVLGACPAGKALIVASVTKDLRPAAPGRRPHPGDCAPDRGRRGRAARLRPGGGKARPTGLTKSWKRAIL